jgi:hypothetical protein
MQIKFLTIYHDFDDEITSKRYAQDSLIYMWQRSVQTQQVKFISSAKVEFKDYNIMEYPNQEKARREIHQAYGHKDKISDYKQVWRWCGETYTDFEIFYNKLAEQKRFMELTITVEDEDYL